MLSAPGFDPVCPACGRRVLPSLQSCGACGHSWSRLDAPTASTGDLPSDETPPRHRFDRRWWWIGGGAVSAGAVAVVVALLLGGSDAPAPPTDQRARDAREVAAALAELPTDPASLRASTRSLADTDAVAAVPSGTTVAADQGSWQPDGAGGGVMRVTLTGPDGTVTSYLAVMVHEGDGWKVLQTVVASGSSSSAGATPTAVAS